MKFTTAQTLQQIASLIGAAYVGDPNFQITGINEIHVVAAGDIVFVDHPKYYDKALKSAATTILINKEVACPKGKSLLISDDPFRDFNKITEHFKPFVAANGSISASAMIGEGTIVQPNVFIGNNVNIFSFSHLEGVKVHNNVDVGPYARIRPGTIINSGSKIGNFVEVKKSKVGKNSKINHLSYIGDTKIGKNVAINAVKKTNSRKVKTCKCDVIFDKKVSSSLLSNLFNAVNAPTIIKGSSFLKKRILLSPSITETLKFLIRSNLSFITFNS